jgi:nuclear autoantigenic sperm protein
MASPSENAAAPLEEAQAPPPPNPNPSGEAAGEGAEGQEEEPKTLERAQELFDRGSKAIEDEDFVDAVDCLSRALEIRLGFRFLPHFPRVPRLLRPSLSEANPRVGGFWE